MTARVADARAVTMLAFLYCLMSASFFTLLLGWWVFPGESASFDALWIAIAAAWTLLGPWFAWRSLLPEEKEAGGHCGGGCDEDRGHQIADGSVPAGWVQTHPNDRCEERDGPDDGQRPPDTWAPFPSSHERTDFSSDISTFPTTEVES